jgi:ubiquinone/menaquinone biosynthesis C-methylase UbiE
MAKLSPLRRLLKIVHPEAMRGVGAAFYNAVSASEIFQRHYELVAGDILSYCSKGALLDVGTGPAYLLMKLHQHSPNMRLAGIDPSPMMLAKGRQNVSAAGLDKVIELKDGGAKDIPFTDESFDIVISTASVHHWKEPTAGINEIYRVLKKGGYTLLYDVVSDTPKEILERFGREVGRLKTFLFWLHGFEEPFYDCKNFASLAQPTLFTQGQTRFVGLFYCLILKK